MKITIHGLDYAASLDAVNPLTIERKLNEPTVCQFWLSLPPQGTLAAPVRNQAVAVTGDDGTLYFTGYIAATPVPEYAGLGISGPRYRLAVRAISDELLLDQVPAAPVSAASGMNAGQLMQSLVAHTRSAALATQGLSVQTPVGSFTAAPGAKWSRAAGQLANQTRTAYRALGGALQLAEIPSAVHPFSETDGTLNLAALSFTSGVKRQLANDITVCGEHEPVAYVTEYFLGDGVTSQFDLGAQPWFPPSSSTAIIEELFDQPAIDAAVWALTGSAFLSLGAGGLSMNGGSGIDGQATLAWIDSMELGGTVLVEASGVRLAAGSSGILSGLYVGSGGISGCVAGFQVNAAPGTGAVTVQPIVRGVATGAAYAINPSNLYTLRIRLHCPECQRALAAYRSFGDDGAITCGGQTNDAPAKVLFEIQEFVNGVAGMPVQLYDGTVSSLPPSCSVVAASLISMYGSMRAFRATNQGTGWVISTPAGSGSYTRRLGTPSQSGECTLDRSGKLVFNAGFVPMAGEQIAVVYRTQGRAVGRVVNAASQQALATSGLPAVAQWIGSVTNPGARSSADCRNAAAAMAAAAAASSALWSGSYRCSNLNLLSDVWPGDALLLDAPSLAPESQVVVREVKLSYASTYPDLVAYDIAFANDWADDLAIQTSDSVPADAWLPAPANPVMLPNLANLAVTSLTPAAITINTGAQAPPGGGFEIRRRDFAFMPGEDSDLVMRGSQQTLTFSRETAFDRFYIRMYDGSTPPNYSEFSTALFINLPVNSAQ